MTLKMIRIFLLAYALVMVPVAVLRAQEDDEEKPDSDAKIEQVVLEANVVQIVLNDEHRQGVDWEAIVSDFHTLQLKKQDNPVWMDKKYKISVGTVSEEDYAVLLEALDTVGHMRQTLQPALVLTPDESKTIEFRVGESEEEPANIRIEASWTNSPKQGPLLHLEPYIGMLIKDAARPVAMTLKTQTDVALRERNTIVVGSIISEEEMTKMHKFPLLGDLPLVGLVFRKQGHWMQKTETMIFLTPRLNAAESNENKT
jgi:type II secretory pathway component GspD/PulD (secretin)